MIAILWLETTDTFQNGELYSQQQKVIIQHDHTPQWSRGWMTLACWTIEAWHRGTHDMWVYLNIGQKSTMVPETGIVGTTKWGDDWEFWGPDNFCCIVGTFTSESLYNWVLYMTCLFQDLIFQLIWTISARMGDRNERASQSKPHIYKTAKKSPATLKANYEY